MTQPVLAHDARGGRVYVWPPTPPYELQVPSVTRIIGDGLPKPQLLAWYSKMSSERAVHEIDTLLAMLRHPAQAYRIALARVMSAKTLEEAQDFASLALALSIVPDDDAIENAIHWLKGAPYAVRNKAANRGTHVHSAIEAYVRGWREVELAKHEGGYFAAACAFLDDYKPEILHTEATIYSREHGYAGTLDTFSILSLLDKPMVLDWKTSKAAYGNYALQLAAYARGDFIGYPDGREEPLPKIENGAVVVLRPDGHYELNLCDLTDEDFAAFLAVKETGRWLNERERKVFKRHGKAKK